MADQTPNTIFVRGGDYSPEPIPGDLSEQATPGDLMEFGGSNDYQKHATAHGDVVPRMFLLTRPSIGENIDDAISSGESVRVRVAQSGDVVWATIDGGNGTVNQYTNLESAGNGHLQPFVKENTGSTNEDIEVEALVGIILEQVDTSGPTDQRAPVLIV